MVNNHDHIILISMIFGGLISWPFGYWKGKEVGAMQARLQFRKLERAKRESK